MTGLVAGMVTIGGITRLTRSGLSMTDWKLTGMMPLKQDLLDLLTYLFLVFFTDLLFLFLSTTFHRNFATNEQRRMDT